MSYEDSDDEQVGLTTVSLGYAGKPMEPKTALENHIGGVPVWLNGTAPASNLYSCGNCQNEMSLMVQISAPLEKKWYDRVLYIFACPSPGCNRQPDTIKAIRGIHKSKEVESRLKEETDVPVSAPISNLGDTLFGSSSAGDNPFASSTANPFASTTPQISQPQSKSGPAKEKKKKDAIDQKGKYLCKEIEVEEEYLTHEDFKMPDNVVIDENPEEPEEAGASNSAGVDPAVEELLSSVSDATFGRFVALIDNNPDQILRYDWPLVPVAYTDDSLSPLLCDATKIPRGLDNTARRFEVQLVPKLISELETPDMLMDGMEWGTVVVATSQDDALPPLDDSGVGYTQEWVGVQWEKTVQH